MSTFVTSAAGVRIPGIVYGTAWKAAHTERLVRLAIREGFRGIDTACQPKHYNEAGVGTALEACFAGGLRREQIYLQTKFTPLSGQDPKRIPYDPAAPLEEQVAQSFRVSLQNLNTAYLDCLMLHSPLPTIQQTLRAWRAIEAIVESGGARQAGISNCYGLAELQQLTREASVKPAVLQNRFYADTGYDRELRAFCKRQHIVYQSFWTLTANPQLLAHSAIAGPARFHGKTAAQVLFRYLTQAGAVPLTGTRSEAHMREDLSIFDFELSTRERTAIDQALAA